ncbi:hypothetical protein [Periweissella ghanensis]|uniref:Uncharacterized protein n=1 Tax=Periweissella ghanensis TaxID=467997 RepID=A0ABM8ZDE6_9LACO|nr:hypothetical protein [Periweissella ghanensis]MCM0600026.1 hypothetical protein [Periweissella ghanensis]CAH0418918.1 hypothetical protein WGH24286_01361 [Periweissella ghanensis]
MRKKDLIFVSIAIILVFISLISWVVNKPELAIIASNGGVVLLTIVYLWNNRHEY